MPALETCKPKESLGLNWNAQIVRNAWADLRETEPVAKPHGKMQDPAMKTPPRTSTDAARAALWTGILGAAKHLGKRAPLPIAPRPSVVQLRQGSAATPVYFIGAGLFEFHIAQLLSPAHSVFAVEITWPSEWHDAAARNDTNASPTLEQMVAPYVAAIGAHARSSPCVIVGYSFHASMAFEAAHQLHDRGGKVEMVMLLDAPAEYPAWHQVGWQKLQEVWNRAPRLASTDRTSRSIACRLESSWSIIRWMLVELGKGLKRSFLQTAMRNPGKLTTKLDTLGRPLPWQLIERLYTNSLRSYRLRRLDSRGVVFRADRKEDCPSPSVDHSLGWANLFRRGLEIIQVTGDHITMMQQQPHDLKLAREMSEVLDRSCAKQTRSEFRGAANTPSPSP
jgi:thioesterase domain-containing protein